VLQTSVPAGHAAEQQLPTPPTSQTPLVHSSSAAQKSPAGRLEVQVPEEQ
jgi:hypothetical protein